MFPKEFIIENGYVYYRKKPLYKQLLFWTTIAGAIMTVLMSVLFTLSLAGWTDLDEESYLDDQAVTEHALGQPVELNNGLVMTVDSLDLDSEVALVDDSYPQTVVVKVTVENPTKNPEYFEEKLALVEGVGSDDQDSWIGVYLLDNRTYDTPLKKKIAPGEKEIFTLIYGVAPHTQYRLRYDEDVWMTLQGESL
ncbi:hypothetical protein GGG87_02030 [Streptococcus sp. zg-86]|uniref:DUF4352 domain-containing protein n=1 Tax=Streptococcus zhangguiae TaxID=2664091 RepID=A0A6I4RH44_9STRE|nr:MULTISPECIES: hypothetical protein [unclassified Streptococcus]MTB63791.1 hypothetical protein [Streptococcus sp. zg-86]MTB90101.1 hypothetical protein [Streptococcus sp. zg-36]MWV55773.1 hypothetical protein [Streptococcus sp. zg-70]QTH47941.1 hypothetical protein J5M87_00970 [Streptococcus sp. zg-86]